MKNVSMDGGRLRLLLAERGLRQRHIAKAVGVTHYNVNRWCQVGVRQLKEANVRKLAEAIGMSFDALVSECSAESGGSKGLSAAESEWLNMFRGLPPLEQAKALLMIDDLVNGKKPTR